MSHSARGRGTDLERMHVVRRQCQGLMISTLSLRLQWRTVNCSSTMLHHAEMRTSVVARADVRLRLCSGGYVRVCLPAHAGVDKPLSAEQEAQSVMLTHFIEDSLYYGLFYHRWIQSSVRLG